MSASLMPMCMVLRAAQQYCSAAVTVLSLATDTFSSLCCNCIPYTPYFCHSWMFDPNATSGTIPNITAATPGGLQIHMSTAFVICLFEFTALWVMRDRNAYFRCVKKRGWPCSSSTNWGVLFSNLAICITSEKIHDAHTPLGFVVPGSMLFWLSFSFSISPQLLDIDIAGYYRTVSCCDYAVSSVL